MTNIGYARVSSTGQDFDGQIDRLKAAGCERIFAEKVSGKSTNGRHQLEKAVRALKPGDTLVAVRLDRLARSIGDPLHLLDQVKAAGARFKALDDPWCDTTTAQGELILTVMGGLAEFERKLIRQRCEEGITRAHRPAFSERLVLPIAAGAFCARVGDLAEAISTASIPTASIRDSSWRNSD